MLINVKLPGADEITQMDDSDLLKLAGGYENDNEVCAWIQYHLKTTGEMVHRSAHVHLKHGQTLDVRAGDFG
jgi:hypothetical protein